MRRGMLVVLAACGSNTPLAPDARVDAPLLDGICGGGEPNLIAPEGGQIEFEYITYDSELQTQLALPSGVTTAARVTAYFLAAQTPEDNPLPTAGACNNLVATKGWPMFIGTPRTELDVGTLDIIGMNGAGIAMTIEPPNLGPGTDDFGRAQDIYYQVFDPNASDFMLPDSAYIVNLGGAGAIPATSYTNAIELPHDFTVNAPALEDNGPLVAGTDFPVNWAPATTSTNDTVLGVTWLADINGAPTHLCPTLHSASTFTIPGTAISEFKQIAQARGVAANKLILRRDAIVHHLEYFHQPGSTEPCFMRRIDMLGITSFQQIMDVN